MERNRWMQRVDPVPFGGKTFAAAASGALLRLSVLQILANVLSALTGSGMVRPLFCLYTACLLGGILYGSLEGAVYTIDGDSIILEKDLGGDTINRVRIPFQSILSIRPAYPAEKLSVSYRQVSYFGVGLRPSLRIRIGWLVSLFSARMARHIIGDAAEEERGLVIAYLAGDRPQACVMEPDETLTFRLKAAAGERWNWDDRLSRAEVVSLQGMCLQRAFPALYPNIRPLVSPEDEAWLAEKTAELQAASEQKKEQRAEKKDSAGPHSEE